MDTTADVSPSESGARVVNGNRATLSATLQLRMQRVLLVGALSSVVAGVLGGLARFDVIAGAARLTAPIHGPLVVLGGFCGVIGLERALALRRSAAFAVPVLAATGAVLLILGASIAPWILVSASLCLCLTNAVLVRRSPAVFSWLMFFGSGVLSCGAAAWALGASVPVVSFSWMAFFVITIVAERLELSRLAPLPGWSSLVISSSCQVLGYLSLAPILDVSVLHRGFGGALALVGLWQLRFDLARRMLGKRGLPRFVAACVLSAAWWLVVGGSLVLTFALQLAGPRYDAVLHCVFIGYALSMVFGHAPIILPVVGGFRVSFSRSFYLPVCLLHGGLLLRVVGGLGGSAWLRQVGAAVSGISLAAFGATVLISSLRRGNVVAATPSG